MLLVINSETGEVVRELRPGDTYVSGEKRKIQEKSEKKSQKEKKDGEQDFFRIIEFQKLNTRELRALMGELSAGEKSFLFSVMPYVDYLSCGIVIDGKETLTTGELADFLGMSKPTVLKSLNSLNEKKLIARCYTGGRGYKYLLNPWLCVKGRMINATLKHIFGEYRVRSRGGRMWKEI